MTTDVKTCARCHTEKPTDEYYRSGYQRKDGSWGLMNICKPCNAEKSREYYQDNLQDQREKARSKQKQRRDDHPTQKQYERAYKLRKKYGISLEDWDALYDLQLGRCGICLVPLAEVKACVDHDHATGAVRGLLCNVCNQGIGYFRDDLEILRRAITYLTEAGEGGD